MPRPRLLQCSRLASRALRTPVVSRTALGAGVRTRHATIAPRQLFSTHPILRQDVPLTAANAAPETAATPIEMTDTEYHELADEYLEDVLVRFEELQDQSDSVDVEFSSGVMTIRVPEKGTYVINKQPPNKQLWLSSPLSGPKRYDWCTLGDGKSGWVYLRDGTLLDQLILEELDMDLSKPLDG